MPEFYHNEIPLCARRPQKEPVVSPALRTGEIKNNLEGGYPAGETYRSLIAANGEEALVKVFRVTKNQVSVCGVRETYAHVEVAAHKTNSN